MDANAGNIVGGMRKKVPTTAEYIKRESAIEAIMSDPPDAHYQSWYAEKINEIPAADVEPLARCKDCKYLQDNNYGYPHEECRWGNGETPDANDFCSYGERKEGAD